MQFNAKSKKHQTDIIFCRTFEEARRINAFECEAVNPNVFPEVAVVYTSPITGQKYIKPVYVVEYYKESKK